MQKQPNAIWSRKKKQDADKTDSRHYFAQAVREIRELVYPSLNKHEKRQYDNAKIKALGGKAQKGQRMPYNQLLCKKAAEKERMKKLTEKEKELGVSLSLNRKASSIEAEADKRRKRVAKNTRKKDGKFLGFGL